MTTITSTQFPAQTPVSEAKYFVCSALVTRAVFLSFHLPFVHPSLEQFPITSSSNRDRLRVGIPSIAPGTTRQAAVTLTELLNTMHSSRRSPGLDVSVADGSANIPAWTKCKYLAVYFLFNLGLTLYNKAVMVQVRLEIIAIASC